MHTPPRQERHYTAMISTPQPEATEAGTRILRAGGNVVDAAIAAALVQGVVDPLMCGIGGFGVVQVALPDGRSFVIDGLGTSPSGVDELMWENDLLGPTPDGFGYRVRNYVNETGPASVMVPGTVKLLEELHSRFGSVPWEELFVDAIRHAKDGWLIRPHVHTVLVQNEAKYGRMNFGDKLSNTPDGLRIYLRDGELPLVGDTIINPELAESLTLLAEQGGSAFYTGSFAEAIATSTQTDGGVLTAQDLAAYSLVDREPLRVTYRDVEVSSPPQPAGGVQLLEMLGILNEFSLSDLEHNSPAHLQLLAEAMKRSLRDKEALWGSASTTDENYAALLRPDSFQSAAADIRSGVKVDVDSARYESRHTTHLSAMDEEGFTISLTHTLGNPSGYIPQGTGFIMNGGMSTFDPRPGSTNSIAPGKRRNSTMAPSIVLSENIPIMSVGAPGASWIGPGMAQVISNVFDFGMPVQDAIMAPRAVATSNAIDISNRIPRETELDLIARGYPVRRSALSYAFSGVHAVTRLDGRIRGGADPQRDGYADGRYATGI